MEKWIVCCETAQKNYAVQGLAFFVLGLMIGQIPLMAIILLLLIPLVLIYFREDTLFLIPYLLVLALLFETIGRSLALSPWIPWEIGKYLGISLLVYGLFLLPRIKRNKIVILGVFALLLPGIIITFFVSDRIFGDLVFNVGGIVFLLMAAYFFSNYQMTREHLESVIIFFLLSFLTVIGILLINGPNPLDIEYTIIGNDQLYLYNNPNQLATLFSSGFAITIFSFIFLGKQKLWLYLVTAIYLFCALLSFSRGGLFIGIGTIIVIICFLLFKKKRLAILLLFIVSSQLFICFPLVNVLTNGKLLMRYQGETSGTLLGEEEKSLNSYSSGRLRIIQSDITLFINHPFWGVGVGQSSVYRQQYKYPFPLAHTEFSRLLSEHGLLGVLLIGILSYLPLSRIIELKEEPLLQAFILLCTFLAIGHTMHSAMRTSVSPILYGLGFIQFRFEKEN